MLSDRFHTPTATVVARALVALLVTATLVCAAKPSVSDDFTSRRLNIGAKIFRALLAADTDLDTKTTASGDLEIGLLYINDRKNAETAKESLSGSSDTRIRGKAVHIDFIRYRDYIAKSGERYAGVFLTQDLNDTQLSQLLSHAAGQRTLVFSPLEGDVERGVPSGIAIEARVRPYLNMEALQKAGIHLKTFFLQVAKKHE